MEIDKKNFKDVNYIDKRFLRQITLYLVGRGITIDEIKHGFTREGTDFMKLVLKNRVEKEI